MEYLYLNENIYLDETWFCANGSLVRLSINDKNIRVNLKNVELRTRRLIIHHAGCVDGFLERSNTQIEYQDNINGDLFKSWVEMELIPAINRINKNGKIIKDNRLHRFVKTIKDLL